MSAASDVFAAMLGCNSNDSETALSEARTGEVVVEDVDEDTMERFVRFVYTGEYEVDVGEKHYFRGYFRDYFLSSLMKLYCHSI